MTTWIKYVATGLVALIIFGAGYRYAAALYQADIDELKSQYALAAKELTDEYREKEQLQAQKLADAWDQLERARAESVDLRHNVERVRNRASALERQLSASGAGACESERKQLARCAKLLAEGAGVVERCASVATDCALKKDALAKVR